MPATDPTSKTDKRLLEREHNQARLGRDALDALESDLPDLADRVARVDDAALETFAQTLAHEKTVRDERIQRLLVMPKRKESIAPPPPEIPLEE